MLESAESCILDCAYLCAQHKTSFASQVLSLEKEVTVIFIMSRELCTYGILCFAKNFHIFWAEGAVELS